MHIKEADGVLFIRQPSVELSQSKVVFDVVHKLNNLFSKAHENTVPRTSIFFFLVKSLGIFEEHH